MPYLKRDGYRLFYREQGQGPLLLVLPGNTASSACHPGEMDYFSDRYRVVSLDFRGTGQSDRVAAWPNDWWTQAADDTAALINFLGQAHALVMGTSGGAVIALLLAIRHPDLVKAIVADSCVARMSAEWVAEVLQQRNLHTPEQIAFWQYAHGDDWQAVIGADSDLFRRFGESGGDWFGDHLVQIQCPVLFTASLQDAALPEVGSQLCRMAEQTPQGEAYLFNGGNHPLMWTRPDEFRRVSDAFLVQHTAE